MPRSGRDVIFFLLHECRNHLKVSGIERKLAGGWCPVGKLYLAEFHRPDRPVLRALSWTYFKVFEAVGVGACGISHDPFKQFGRAMGRVSTCENGRYRVSSGFSNHCGNKGYWNP